jgi:pyruvate/2-oxoglutarate dehydrogenase complex dihydrolipoamide acyltransferase (E2) component
VACVNASEKQSGLAGTAGAPRPAAATATNAAPATTAAATSAAPAAAASAAPSQLLRATADVFLVEDMERRKADVGDFFLAKGETLGGRIIRRLWDVRSRHSRCRRATNQ